MNINLLDLQAVASSFKKEILAISPVVPCLPAPLILKQKWEEDEGKLRARVTLCH